MANLFQVISAAVTPRQKSTLSPVSGRGGWLPLIRESYTGAWQRNRTINRDSVLSFHAVFTCQTLIASDISKLAVKLMQRDTNSVWREVTNPAYSPVLRKPNSYQNRQQFFESWVLSKLKHGNALILKRRDNRNVVTQLHVLDWSLVTPLVSEDGSVFYDLRCDNLAGLPEQMIVPASEVIHDRWNTLFHPLVGLSPIYANGLAATHGLSIQNNSVSFFENNSQPGGILTAPEAIKDETAARIKEYWSNNFSGNNAGKVAVLGDGLKYEPLAVTAVDAQLVEQLKWSAETVCATYHVPAYMAGVGPEPTHNNAQVRQLQYYSQCLQSLIEAIELCLDEGLGMADDIGVEFDLDGLLRMDSVTQVQVIGEAVKAGAMAPNEARARFLNLGPVEGGETPYLQMQNYSLGALSRRDALPDPFASPAAPHPAPPGGEDTKALAACIASLVDRLGAPAAGTATKSATLYQGTWATGREYEPDQFVTHGGSLWACKAMTSARPGEDPDAWQLAVKRGRNGKDAPL